MAKTYYCQDCDATHEFGKHTAVSSKRGSQEVKATLATADDGTSRRRQPSNVIAGSNPAPVANLEKRKRAPRGTFDRTAYQREWMRRKRAAEKATP